MNDSYHKSVLCGLGGPYPSVAIGIQPVVATIAQSQYVKVVLHRSHGYFFGVKVKSVKLIGRRRFLAARSGLNVRIIQMMAFIQIMDIWRPGRSLEDHLKGTMGVLDTTGISH